MPVLLQHIVLNVSADILLVISGGELLAVAVIHGLPHAVADSLAGVRIDRIDILVGNGKGLDQIVLGRHCFLFGCDPTKRAQHRAVPPVLIPLNRDEAAPAPAAALIHIFLDHDGLVAQTRVNGVKIREAAHERLV